MKLDKDTTTIMKGYGILFIALHNFLHIRDFAGFVKENENTFDVQRTWDYIDALKSFDLSVVGQFFSFLGWIGVSTFVFVSGFGLVKKYNNSCIEFNIVRYVFHCWKKLVILLIPGAVYFILLSFASGTWGITIPKFFLQLTLLNNFFIPMISVSPGTYWYFGLAFEFYLLYLLVKQWNTKKLLLFIGGLLLIQVVMISLYGPNSDSWSWVRHNFLGWGQVFLAGIIVAKTNIDKYLPNNVIILLLLSIMSLIMLPLMQLNVWIWLLMVPFVAFLFFVFFSGAINQTRILKRVGLWLGEYSAFIFVVHPIVRSFVRLIIHKDAISWWQITIIYSILVVVGAIAYKPLYKGMMINKIGKERDLITK